MCPQRTGLNGFLGLLLYCGFGFFAGETRRCAGGDKTGEGFFLRGEVGIFCEVGVIEAHAVGTGDAEGEHADLVEVFLAESVGKAGKLLRAFVVEEVKDPSAGFYTSQDIARAEVAVGDSSGMHTTHGSAQFGDEVVARLSYRVGYLEPGDREPCVDVGGVDDFFGDQKAGQGDGSQFFNAESDNRRAGDTMIKKDERGGTSTLGAAGYDQVLEDIDK